MISAIEEGLGRLPLLLHELGLTLDHARDALSVHGVHKDDVVTAVQALSRAANTASDLAEPLVDRTRPIPHGRRLPRRRACAH